jgi:hypothetical protein
MNAAMEAVFAGTSNSATTRSPPSQGSQLRLDTSFCTRVVAAAGCDELTAAAGCDELMTASWL